MGIWSNLVEKLVEYIPFTAMNLVWRMIDRSGKSLLDVGCGQGRVGSVIKRHRDIYTVGVDAYNPYLELCKKDNSYDKLIQSDVRKLSFENKSFDVVLCTQLIEHLEKAEAYELIKRMEDIARKQIVITTPVGKYEAHARDGNDLQEHKSTWQPAELKQMGYSIRGVGLRNLYGDAGIRAHVPGFTRPIVDIIYVLVGPVAFFLPQIACHMVCQKTL
jgi:SAM-dependent methyltransferase